MSSDLKSVIASYSSSTKNVRKTIDAIIDGSSFVELDAFIGGANELGEIKGEGVLCGLASIGENDVALFAINSDVFNGGISKRGAEKIERLISRAIDACVPLVSIIDTEGARVLEGIDALYGYGLVLNGFSRAYGQIPVITVVKGKNYGMLTYLAGLSDFFIAYDKAQIATASPLLISSSADGKNYSDVKSHYEVSGIITNIVKSDAELKTLLVKALGEIEDVISDPVDDANRVCKGLTTDSTVDKVLKSAFDADSVIELRAGVATNVITALAKLNGISVGVVGVNGKLTAKGSAKITDFLNTVSNLGLPVINLVGSTGIIVDAHQETHCLIRNVSDLIYAYNNIGVPKIALVCSGAVGAAYSIFASKKTFDYTIAWDGAAITPLESASAARLLYGDEIAKSKDPATAEAKFAKVYAEENSAMAAAEKGYIDTVILPNHSRQYLIAALQTMVKR